MRDGWVIAEDTTLGADNGIGVALALAALEEPGLVHPPLEVLLTVNRGIRHGRRARTRARHVARQDADQPRHRGMGAFLSRLRGRRGMWRCEIHMSPFA